MVWLNVWDRSITIHISSVSWEISNSYMVVGEGIPTIHKD